MTEIEENYLLDKKVKIFQPKGFYHASSDAVWLAAALKKVKKGDNILDVGSGGGAISLCLGERFKNSEITITGVEIQSLLAETANKSALANKFDFIKFENANIFECKFTPCSFSHVVTNPPYAEKDMPSPNESKAAAHNFQFEGLKSWIEFCIKMLKPKGRFYMINRAEALENIITAISGKLGNIEIYPLYSKEGQPAKRVIVTAQKDSKAPMILHEGIVVHNKNGDYSEKANDVLRKGLAI